MRRGPNELLRASLLTALVAGVAVLVSDQVGQGRPWIPDAVVLSLILGLSLRAAWPMLGRLDDSLGGLARYPLEVAIALLGMSVSLASFLSLGPALGVAVVLTVCLALGGGLVIGRWAGLPRSHALLVASGNAICGNSAIAAVARVIRAPAAESASSIALTAVLSVGVVLLLPLGGLWLGLSDMQYGVWAGLTVYAVPQVLAATFPVSDVSGEIGTLVKLGRVLLLVPLLVTLARVTSSPEQQVVRWRVLFPPYMLLFVGGAVLQGFGVLPASVTRVTREVSHALTVFAMAAMGLSVQWSSLRTVGARTMLAAAVSMFLLASLALAATRAVVH